MTFSIAYDGHQRYFYLCCCQIWEDRTVVGVCLGTTGDFLGHYKVRSKV